MTADADREARIAEADRAAVDALLALIRPDDVARLTVGTTRRGWTDLSLGHWTLLAACRVARAQPEPDMTDEREALPLLNRLYDLDAEAPLLTQPEQHSLARLLGRPLCGKRGE